MSWRSAILVLVTLVSSTAHAQSIYIQPGFLTGQKYLDASEGIQRGYVMGLVDGLFTSPLFGAPKAGIVPFENCVQRMTDAQVAAILTKYLRDRPAQWHVSAHIAFVNAMREACGITSDPRLKP